MRSMRRLPSPRIWSRHRTAQCGSASSAVGRLDGSQRTVPLADLRLVTQMFGGSLVSARKRVRRPLETAVRALGNGAPADEMSNARRLKTNERDATIALIHRRARVGFGPRQAAVVAHPKAGGGCECDYGHGPGGK